MNETRTAGPSGVSCPDTGLRLADPEDPARDVGLGESGEILVKGPQVFAGYHERPEETAAAFHNGWFRARVIAKPDQLQGAASFFMS